MASFDAFVLLAEMRTGSNHLEASLGALSDVSCHGELFNPAFVGAPGRTVALGFDHGARSADPIGLLNALRAAPEITGFRYFHDHDPRVFDAMMEERRIAKVILTRNPLDSYVSLGIARATGQWRLTDPRRARQARMHFDGDAFDAMTAAHATFRAKVEAVLQRTGQAAFRIGYEDIGCLAALNGLAAFLGSGARLECVPTRIKRQNPGPLDSKVKNPEAMRAHLAGRDPFGLDADSPQPAPGRIGVRTLAVAAESPILALPLPGGPSDALTDWLRRLDGAEPVTGLTQRGMRRWMRDRPGFVCIALLRHPLSRAHGAWRAHLADRGPAADRTRRVLASQHGVPLVRGCDRDAEADGFTAFLRAMAEVLGGRSALVAPPTWASQAALLAESAPLTIAHHVLREDHAQATLDAIAKRLGRMPVPLKRSRRADATLARIHRPEHEALCRDAYRRDYRQLGFGDWSIR